uniref:Uncharacterized protein n=1 Tax=uncultured marine virus TaxID=186617 RepID=A0A0F7L8A7_9VIRU|nr:hypothetical protein [uncultured marine virus]
MTKTGPCGSSSVMGTQALRAVLGRCTDRSIRATHGRTAQTHRAPIRSTQARRRPIG